MSLELSNQEAEKEVKNEIERTLKWMAEQAGQLDGKEIADFVNEILTAKKRIFVTGKGRSGLVGRAFAMRLVHEGYDARDLAEDTAPPVQKDNLFIIISGGGENRIKEAETAKGLGARIIAITSYPESSLAKIAHLKLIIPGRKKEGADVPYRERRMKGLAVLVLGTSFEDLCLIFLDSVIGYIAALKGESERDLDRRHTKLQI